MFVFPQKSLVTALRELHSKRPPPDQVQTFLVAVLKGEQPPDFQPDAKVEDEGVYEYFKTKGVFGLLKVSSTVSCYAFPLFAVQPLQMATRRPCVLLSRALREQNGATDESLVPVLYAVACADLRRQAPAGRRTALPRDLSGYSGGGAVGVMRRFVHVCEGMTHATRRRSPRGESPRHDVM